MQQGTMSYVIKLKSPSLGGFTQLDFLKVAQRLNQSWDLVICNLFFFLLIFFFWGVGVLGPKNQVPRPQHVGDSKRSFPAQRLN